MEIQSALAIGTASGLAASLIIRPLWSTLIARGNDEVWRRSTTRNETLYIVAHAFAGAAQGLMFWLSWGLAAIVAVPWWQRGLSVGLVNAALVVLPSTLITASIVRGARMIYWVLITEALVVSVCVGLACSWTWAHSP